MTGTFSKKSFLCDLLAFLFLCPPLPSLLRFIGFDVYVVLSLLPGPPPCRAICHQCHVSVPTPSFPRTDLPYLNLMFMSSSPCCPAVARTKRSGARTALVFRQVSLLVCFVSHGFASVSHPKFLFRFEAKQAKLGGQFRYFASKSFASFRFSFASKRNSGTP